MGTAHRRRGRGRWTVGVMAGFLFALLSQSGHGLEAPEPPAGEGSPATRLHLTVRQGRLSVDLWEAEVGKVLARLAHEAGLVILGGPRGGTRVSAQFTDVELEGGLRHLMRLAALSYAMRYAQDPTGTVVAREVQVFEPVKEGPPPSSHTTERSAEEREATSAASRGRAGEVRPHVRNGRNRGNEGDAGTRDSGDVHAMLNAILHAATLRAGARPPQQPAN